MAGKSWKPPWIQIGNSSWTFMNYLDKLKMVSDEQHSQDWGSKTRSHRCLKDDEWPLGVALGDPSACHFDAYVHWCSTCLIRLNWSMAGHTSPILLIKPSPKLGYFATAIVGFARNPVNPAIWLVSGWFKPIFCLRNQSIPQHPANVSKPS